MVIATPKEIKDILNKENKMKYKWVTRCGKTILVHQLIWIEHFGEIPKGYVIHHKNKNKKDNRIENLQCMTIKEHFRAHKSNG